MLQTTPENYARLQAAFDEVCAGAYKLEIVLNDILTETNAKDVLHISLDSAGVSDKLRLAKWILKGNHERNT